MAKDEPMRQSGGASSWIRGFLAVLLPAIGVFISATLSLTHAHGSLIPCGGSGDCAAVADSAYSMFLGLPVAYYGLFGYCCLELLAVLGGVWSRARMASLVLSGLGSLASLVLLSVSLFLIDATCKWCIGSAITMISILILDSLSVRHPVSARALRQAALAVAFMVLAYIGAVRVVA